MPSPSEMSAEATTVMAPIRRRWTARLWASRVPGVAPSLTGLGITSVPPRDDRRLDHRGLHPGDGRMGIHAGPRGRGPVAWWLRGRRVPRLADRAAAVVGRLAVA